MKATITENLSKFKPFTLSLTVEAEDEENALYAIGNVNYKRLMELLIECTAFGVRPRSEAALSEVTGIIYRAIKNR